MNKRTRTSPTLKIAAVLLATYGLPAMAQSDSAQVLFTNDKLTVIDAKGVERVARQGDFLHPGDIVKTPIGVIGQIKLPDGTLVSARPDSEIKLDVIDHRKGRNSLAINQGNVRVINVDLPGRPQPFPIDLITPGSTLQLTGGDGEAIHIKPGSSTKVEPGTYTRLQLGTGLMSNPRGDLPLLPMQSGFVPRADIVPVGIASLPPLIANFTPTIGTLTSVKSPTTLPSVTAPLTFTPSIGASILTNPTLATTAIMPTALNPAPPGSGPTPGAAGIAPQVGTALIQPAVLATIKPITISTAVVLRPPPPPPTPPPPKLIIIKKFP